MIVTILHVRTSSVSEYFEVYQDKEEALLAAWALAIDMIYSYHYPIIMGGTRKKIVEALAEMNDLEGAINIFNHHGSPCFIDIIDTHVK